MKTEKKLPFFLVIIGVVSLGSAFISVYTHWNINDINNNFGSTADHIMKSDYTSNSDTTGNNNNDKGDSMPMSIDSYVNNVQSEETESRKQNNDEEIEEPKLEVVPAISNSTSSQDETNEPKARFAYAFLVAGCDPQDPTYLGYIYNIIVAKRIFIERGSTNDVLVMIRMHIDTHHTKLPPEHEEMFHKGNVIVKYIPKPHADNFHTAMMDKFRILNLVEYDRVIFLDSDVIPIFNLDYLFNLSMKDEDKSRAILEENVILAYKGEPANGGFFMLKPNKQDYLELTSIVRKTEESGYKFNETIGWGHIFTPDDIWLTYKYGSNGTKWDWHGAFSDQGLLYYWTKYYKKKVSIIIKDVVQRWLPDPENRDKVIMVEKTKSSDIFGRPARFVLAPQNHYKKEKPYGDFEHFIGKNKPWIDPRKVGVPEDCDSMDTAKNTKQMWFHILRILNKELNLGIDVEHLRIGLPLLGIYPQKGHVEESRDAKLLMDGNGESHKTSSSTPAIVGNDNSVASPEDTSSEKFAYVFLVAGCDPSDPTYLGYIYNIIVAKRMLVEGGSIADVVVMIRMHTNTNRTTLPPEHEKFFHEGDVIVKYLPKPHVDNFHTAMMDKFRVLKLTEYSRVLFLDSDVMPIYNLDYMFTLSTGPNPKLEENVVLAYKGEPANGGFFMLKPDEQDYDALMEVVAKTEEAGYHFNETLGWGHIITPPDEWVTYRWETGTLWNWHGAFTDQGLLYHWVKYQKKKASIVIKNKVQRWLANEQGESVMVEETKSSEIFGRPKRFVLAPSNHYKNDKPYSDFEHFIGEFKPWIDPNNIGPLPDIESMELAKTTAQLWFHMLRVLNREKSLGIDVEHLKIGEPVLGFYPTNNMVEESKHAKNLTNQQIAMTEGEGGGTGTKPNAVGNSTNERFAYAFLIAGCDPSDPNYRGYIYSVAVSKELFRRFGSKTDVIVMVRMHQATNHTKLPPEDEQILTKSGLIIKYLPKPQVDNFHTAMMDKFRILQFTEYSRILYLDSDVIPLNNLDYIFDLSTGPNAVLEENLAIAYNREPANGGFFMLNPEAGDYDKIREIIEKREREGYHFNETIGWGHEMIPPDGWESLKGFQGNKWDFYGSFTDQGLIYHWTKYVKKRVTIVNGPRVKTWMGTDDGVIQLVRDVPGKEIFGHIEKTLNTRAIHRGTYNLPNHVPYRDFHHFKEFFKPWVAQKKHRIDHGPHELWFNVLREINERYGFGVNVDDIGFDKPKLGLFPTFNDVEAMKKIHENEEIA